MPAAPRRQQRSTDVRDRLIDAALQEFAANGFEGASTRKIAERAGTHQPQINYHFESKLELWKAAMTMVMTELDSEMLQVLPAGFLGSSVSQRADGVTEAEESARILRLVCKQFVRFAARRPELNRIMVHESTAPSERLDWMVDEFIQARFILLGTLVPLLDSSLVATTDPVIFYYTMVGAGSLLAVNAAEAQRLAGPGALTDRIEQLAQAVADMLLGRETPEER
jgi:TetR/AcrR family transcriptional regulator